MTTKLVTSIPIKEVIPFWPGSKFQVPGLAKVGAFRYQAAESCKVWEERLL